MKILVLSDTHGEIEKAKEVIENNKGVDLVIHLGDYFRDAQKLSGMFPGIHMEYVYGNSDFEIGDVPSEKTLDYYGKKIFITHGHRYSVKWDYNRLCKKAEELQTDLLLFGHTHIAHMQDMAGYILLNPGSITEPRSDLSESYAVIEIGNDKIDPKLVFLGECF